MPLNLPPFADSEAVLQALLSQLGPPVVKALPDTIEPPLIAVKLLGGTSDYISDTPELQVSTFGATRQEAVDLALQVQALVENSFNTFVTLPSGTKVQIDGTSTVTAAHPEVYENNNVREIPAVYYLILRRPRTYYVV